MISQKSKQRVIVIILGGGKGTRLLPLTEKRSKPAVSFGGKYRLIDIPISNALNSGFMQIYVLTQYNSYSLNRHIARTYNFNSVYRQGFVEIIAAEQTMSSVRWFEGTADAVRKILPRIEDYRADHIIILSGDQLYNMDLSRFLEEHTQDTSNHITIAAKPVPADMVNALGILSSDKDGWIRDFYEKPADLKYVDSFRLPDGNYLASMGIYLFNTSTLIELLEDPTFTDFGKEIIPYALKTHKVKSFIYDGYWEDIGTIKSFFEANLMLTDDIPKFDLYMEDTPFYTRPRYLPPIKVNKSNINRALLSEGCIINDSTIIRSVIGVRQVIEPGTHIENSLVMGADSYGTSDPEGLGIPVGIGKNCIIKNCIIDKDCYIGNDVKLINKAGHQEYEDNYVKITDGIIVVKRRATIPNGYEI
jgi:glucose-1-phosphate adenylyltransferase